MITLKTNEQEDPLAQYIPEEDVRAGGTRPKVVITDVSMQVQKRTRVFVLSKGACKK